MVVIITKKENKTLEIIVDGEIDASSSIELDNALEKAFSEETKILVNLEKLQYISSAGLGVFISRLEALNENQLQMVLFGLNEKVKQVFDILGLHQLLTIAKSKSEAIELLK